jgi:CheY-like chemotaxis protein
MTSHTGVPGPRTNANTGRIAFRDGFGGVATRRPTALVVENDFGSKVALTALLERVKMNVVAVASGHTALDALADRDDIAIVLMDIMMPIMDGYETMTVIRKRSRFADLPIIAVTAKDGVGERERCLAAGASDYVPKPVDTATLLAAVAAWMKPEEAAPATDW